MALPTEYYVDPSLTTDTGDGSKSTPWGRVGGSGVIQYALDTITKGTGGDRINVKEGSDDVLLEDLNVTTYGAPTAGQPLIIQGYTTDEGDGGKGGIDGDSLYNCFSGTETYTSVVDMTIHDGSSGGYLLYVGNLCRVHKCEVYNAGRGINTGAFTSIWHNYVHDCTLYHIIGGSYCNVSFNYVDDTIGGWAIYHPTHSVISHNVVVVSTTSGIRTYGDSVKIHDNTLFSEDGAGYGIKIDTSNTGGAIVMNNVFEGFTTNAAVDWNNHVEPQWIYINNAYYNCGTIDANKSGVTILWEENNETLSESPFEKEGSPTYANRAKYFKLRNVGSTAYGANVLGSRMAKGALPFTLKNPTTYFAVGM